MENKPNFVKKNQKFLNRKTKRDKFTKRQSNEEAKPPQLEKFSKIEVMFRKAKALYEDKVGK